MSRPELSVVMATYNQAATLAEALESLLLQDLGPDRWEVIVVDDGSTDRTPELLRRYAGRVKVHTQTHQGLPAACNAGLAQAGGEYLARMDSDDRVEPDWVRQELELLRAHPEACAVYPDYAEFREDGSVLPRPAQQENLYSLMACGTLFRTEALRAVGGYRPFYWEEYDLYLRLRQRWLLLHLPKPLYFVRSHPARMTARAEQRQQGWKELIREWGRETLLSAGTDPELEEIAACTSR